MSENKEDLKNALKQMLEFKPVAFKGILRKEGQLQGTWGVEVTYEDGFTNVLHIYLNGSHAKKAAKRAKITGKLPYNTNEPDGPLHYYDPENP